MEAALKLKAAGSVDDEVERLRAAFSTTFSGLNDELDELQRAPVEQKGGIPADLKSESAGDGFDWSVTLGNVRQLVEARQDSEARLLAAEERARRAEARAAEAEHWLRRLHQAVLEGLPVTKEAAPR